MDIADAIKKIQPDNFLCHSLFVLSDYKYVDGEHFMNSIKKSIPTLWKSSGGFAGDNWAFEGARFFANESIYSEGAIFTYINSHDKAGLGIRHGFKEIANSQTFKVPSIELNILKELNGPPALDVYIHELKKHGLLKEGEDILKKLASYPIGMRTILGEKLKIRTPLAIKGKNFVLAGSIPINSEVKIVTGKADALLKAAQELKELTLYDLGKKTGNMQLVIDCAGRYRILGNRYNEEVTNLKLDEITPMLGFTSYGEFAKFGISVTDFHNTTAVSCVW